MASSPVASDTASIIVLAPPAIRKRFGDTFCDFRPLRILQILDKWLSHDLLINQFDSFISLIGVSLKYNGFFAR
jgi:hypothetical protein